MVMMDKIEDMMELLRTMGASVVGTTDDFYGEANDNNGIWISAESTPSLFNYYSEAWGNTFGVNPELNDVVEQHGWFFEWYDAGTMMVWEN
tara:strand:- start:157 stop:429 length:273 start_codon:yes stop_codon:yes gene_type:complete